MLISCLAYTLTMNMEAIRSSEISGSPWTTLPSYCRLFGAFTKSRDPNSNSGQISLQITVTVSLTYIQYFSLMASDSSLIYNKFQWMSRNYRCGTKLKICFCCICHSHCGTNQNILCTARKNYLCSLVEWYTEWPKIPLNIQSSPKAS
jgi:hypothetical protein